MTKKFALVTAIITVVVLFLIIFSYSLVWDRLELVQEGLASPKFPYLKYSQDELNKMYPQYVNVDIETTQTPEQTHRIFVDKLKAGDIDGAVECCFMKGDWEKMKEGLENVKNEGHLNLMISEVSEIEKEMVLDTIASYTYYSDVDGKYFANTISFVKNSKGVWLIESL